jgi:prevent-host-death family protein
MKSASISEAKNRLSAYIDRVRRGETVLITDRGNPVARLAPLEPGSRPNRDARVAQLARAGILRLAAKPPLRRLTKPITLRSRRIDVVRVVSESRGRY